MATHGSFHFRSSQSEELFDWLTTLKIRMANFDPLEFFQTVTQARNRLLESHVFLREPGETRETGVV